CSGLLPGIPPPRGVSWCTGLWLPRTHSRVVDDAPGLLGPGCIGRQEVAVLVVADLVQPASAGAARGVPVAGGRVVGRDTLAVHASGGVDVQPLATGLDHVAGDGDVLAAFVEVDADTVADVEDVIFADHRTRIGRQVVDGAAVHEPGFDAMDPVAGHQRIAQRGRRFGARVVPIALLVLRR